MELNLRSFLAFILAAGLLLGCSTEETGPWVPVDPDRFGGIMKVPTEDGVKISAKNGTFGNVLQQVAYEYDSVFVVSPPSLLDKGVRLVVEGADVQSVLTNLANICSLEIEEMPDGKWQVKDPSASDHTEVVMKVDDW